MTLSKNEKEQVREALGSIESVIKRKALLARLFAYSKDSYFAGFLNNLIKTGLRFELGKIECASYSPTRHRMIVNPDLLKKKALKKSGLLNVALKQVFLHEMQHAIDNIDSGHPVGYHNRLDFFRPYIPQYFDFANTLSNTVSCLLNTQRLNSTALDHFIEELAFTTPKRDLYLPQFQASHGVPVNVFKESLKYLGFVPRDAMHPYDMAQIRQYGEGFLVMNISFNPFDVLNRFDSRAGVRGMLPAALGAAFESDFLNWQRGVSAQMPLWSGLTGQQAKALSILFYLNTRILTNVNQQLDEDCYHKLYLCSIGSLSDCYDDYYYCLPDEVARFRAMLEVRASCAEHLPLQVNKIGKSTFESLCLNSADAQEELKAMPLEIKPVEKSITESYSEDFSVSDLGEVALRSSILSFFQRLISRFFDEANYSYYTKLLAKTACNIILYTVIEVSPLETCLITAANLIIDDVLPAFGLDHWAINAALQAGPLSKAAYSLTTGGDEAAATLSRYAGSFFGASIANVVMNKATSAVKPHTA